MPEGSERICHRGQRHEKRDYDAGKQNQKSEKRISQISYEQIRVRQQRLVLASLLLTINLIPLHISEKSETRFKTEGFESNLPVPELLQNQMGGKNVMASLKSEYSLTESNQNSSSTTVPES